MVTEAMRKEMERRCKHNVDFICEMVGEVFTFLCAKRCGFSLNFDPDIFPAGPTYIKREQGKTIDYTSKK